MKKMPKRNRQRIGARLLEKLPKIKWSMIRRSILFSAIINSVCLLILSYFFSNISIPVSSTEFAVLKKAEQMKDRFHINNSSEWNDSVLLINTSFDFDTIPYYCYTSDTIRYTKPEGYYAITRRIDLYHVLKAFSQDTTSYKYIILDIALDSLPRNHSKYVDTLAMYTDSLVNLIVAMPRICVAQSKTFTLVSDRLKEKSGMVDYRVTSAVSSFVKYQLIGDSTMALPMRMYNDLSSHSIQSRMFGLFYTDGCHLCRKSIIPTYPFRYKTSIYGWDIVSDVNSTDTIYYKMEDHYNLHQFNKWYTDEDVKEISEGKIVVIGDLFAHDIHTTYAGSMSGALINLNTYINLANGNHIINVWVVICLFIFYIGTFYFVIYGEKWWFKIPFWKRFWQADVTQLVISFLSWALIFHGLALVLYSFGIFYNIWLPVVWFTLVTNIYKIIILPKYEK